LASSGSVVERHALYERWRYRNSFPRRQHPRRSNDAGTGPKLLPHDGRVYSSVSLSLDELDSLFANANCGSLNGGPCPRLLVARLRLRPGRRLLALFFFGALVRYRLLVHFERLRALDEVRDLLSALAADLLEVAWAVL